MVFIALKSNLRLLILVVSVVSMKTLVGKNYQNQNGKLPESKDGYVFCCSHSVWSTHRLDYVFLLVHVLFEVLDSMESNEVNINP